MQVVQLSVFDSLLLLLLMPLLLLLLMLHYYRTRLPYLLTVCGGSCMSAACAVPVISKAAAQGMCMASMRISSMLGSSLHSRVVIVMVMIGRIGRIQVMARIPLHVGFLLQRRLLP